VGGRNINQKAEGLRGEVAGTRIPRISPRKEGGRHEKQHKKRRKRYMAVGFQREGRDGGQKESSG